MRLSCDLESNGLLHELNQIHCISVQDIDSDWSTLIVGHEKIKEWLHLLKGIDHTLIFHNGFVFDCRAINKVFGIDLTKTHRIEDTFILSQLFYPDLKNRDFGEFSVPKDCIGSHSLKAWGHRLKCFKGEYKGRFEEYNEAMGKYCSQDTLVTKTLYKFFEVIKKDKIERDDCIETEYAIAPILARQQEKGVLFDIEAAKNLETTLRAEKVRLRQKLQEVFTPRIVNLGEVEPKVNSQKYHTKKGAIYTKIKFEEYNPSSRKQTIDRLITELGWTPQEFTDKGNPELDEEVLEALPFGQLEPLKDYYTIDKRLGQIANGTQAWLKQVKGDSRIYGGIMQSGTITRRMSHFRPNMAQCVAKGKKWGTECRSLFKASPGYILVGCDADALELRTLAGYLKAFDGGKYIEMILKGKKEEGTDMHSIHAQALDFSRDCAKQFLYAMVYGAANPKLGLIMQQHGIDFRSYLPDFDKQFISVKKWAEKKQTGFSDKYLECLIVGKAARERFGERLPALPQLIEHVTKTFKDRGYLLSLDGSKLKPRRDNSIFNTLNQAAGAIIMKKALQIADEQLQLNYTLGKEYEFVINCHDEFQLEVLNEKEVIDKVKNILENSIIEGGRFFKFPCPMLGHSISGSSWADTH